MSFVILLIAVSEKRKESGSKYLGSIEYQIPKRAERWEKERLKRKCGNIKKSEVI